MSELAVGDTVETIKGARFWGVILSIEYDDPRKPGATVKAIALGFEGTKHVYPLSQLQRRVSPLSDGDGCVKALEAELLAAREALSVFADYPVSSIGMDLDGYVIKIAMGAQEPTFSDFDRARALSGNRSGKCRA